jgi:Arc/MetJ-type ribon-helix-helix transcriptional regulator
MSTQIAIRLPDEVVEFVDSQVSSGAAKSRADFVWRAIRREQRRLAAERDAEIYATDGPDPEMDAFVAHTSRRSLDHLD